MIWTALAATAADPAHMPDAHMPEAHGTFPPFDPATFASQLFWLALTFGFLYWFVKRHGAPRIAGLLEARHARIEADLGEARRLKGETDAAIAGYESALAQARTRAQAIAAETRAKLDADMDAKRAEAEARIAARTSEAEASIAAVKARALSEVGAIATDTASALVERLIGGTPTPDEIDGAVARASAA